MENQKKKPVKIVETVFRDAHQSLLATRMSTEQMLPIIDKMDQVGYHAVECWGGAIFLDIAIMRMMLWITFAGKQCQMASTISVSWIA